MKVAIAAVVLLTCPFFAHATVCQSGSVASFDGSICSIGDLTFSFGAAQVVGGSESPASFFLTPFVNGNDQGFTVTGNLSASSPLLLGAPMPNVQLDIPVTAYSAGVTIDAITTSIANPSGQPAGSWSTGTGAAYVQMGSSFSEYFSNGVPQSPTVTDAQAQSQWMWIDANSPNYGPYAIGSLVGTDSNIGYYASEYGGAFALGVAINNGDVDLDSGTLDINTLPYQVTPEPGTLILVGTGLLGLGGLFRRLRAKRERAASPK